MSHGQWRREQSRKVCRTLKNVLYDIGNMTGRAIGKMHYGAGVSRTNFAKQMIENKETTDV